MPYVLGLIGSIATAVVIAFLNQLTGREMHSLIFLFIIPFGGILLGMGGAGGFFFGRKLTNTKVRKIDYITAIILGLFTFFSVNYISYSTTYLFVDDSNEVEITYYFSKPEEVYTSVDQLMTFGDYINMTNSGSTYKISGRTKNRGGFEIGKTATTILFYVQIISVLLGALMAKLLLTDSRYCDRFKNYYKDRVLKKFGLEKFDKHIKILTKMWEEEDFNMKQEISLERGVSVELLKR